MSKSNEHYKEGNISTPFKFHGVEMNIALCGDMWIYPESFKTNGILIWPVYVNFDLDENEASEYAKQANLTSKKTLLINPISKDPISKGGAFYFKDGRIKNRVEIEKEEILIVEVI